MLLPVCLLVSPQRHCINNPQHHCPHHWFSVTLVHDLPSRIQPAPTKRCHVSHAWQAVAHHSSFYPGTLFALLPSKAEQDLVPAKSVSGGERSSKRLMNKFRSWLLKPAPNHRSFDSSPGISGSSLLLSRHFSWPAVSLDHEPVCSRGFLVGGVTAGAPALISAYAHLKELKRSTGGGLDEPYVTSQS